MNDIISIIGVSAELVPIERSKQKGLNADMILRFLYYTANFKDQDLCVIQAKNKDESITPSQYKRITQQIETVVGMPVAVLLDSPAYYERERLIDQGVYFIVSDKYAFLPSLIVNTRARKVKKATKLIPAAQYILLYYLLSEKKEFTIKELERTTLYNYVAMARAVSNLEDCKLCYSITDHTRTKYIRFEESRKELWKKSQKYLSSPVKKVVYCDFMPVGNFSISGVNALSQYTHLNPEQYGTWAIWEKYFSTEGGQYNGIEGIYKIEVWNYPTFMPSHPDNKIVDKLSLFLSMKDDPDSRIEKELEIMIEEMKW
ncbi:hypothetical protein AQPE_0276 [Aquipluma nitroreducens]|uniref:Uncharacterized protein n=1 Tax=Aquipluma nitroreducens TaxID=2010828 RepID=A0A5K7S3R6_9BACT|nr:hypothetical protein [Aquipluma nitroreducens]BBE16139.1 hypothetical protein AQPE_0276 [Aquipluma nitroreducens]